MYGVFTGLLRFDYYTEDLGSQTRYIFATAGPCFKVVDVTVNNIEQTVAKFEETEEAFIKINGHTNKSPIGVRIDPNRQADNIMRIYVQNVATIQKFEFDQDTQTFVSFTLYNPASGGYNRADTTILYPSTYVNMATEMPGRISPWEHFWVCFKLNKRNGDDWEVLTYSKYFNDYSESLDDRFVFLSDEPEEGSDESNEPYAYWFRAPAQNQYVEQTGYLDIVFHHGGLRQSSAEINI